VPLSVQGQAFGALWLSTFNSEKVLTEEVSSRASFFAYNLIQYSRVSQEIERLRIEIDVREKTLLQIRQDVLTALTSVQLLIQMIERNQDPAKNRDYTRRENEFINKISDVIRGATESIDMPKAA
jgi:GAF domain-containing protein